MRNLLSLLVLGVSIITSLEGVLADEAQRVLKIGVIAPLSGELAVFGTKMVEGVELAKEKLKNEPVEFFIEDSGEVTKPTVVAATHKLISINKIDLLIGLIYEDQLSKIVPLLQRAGIPVFGAALCSEVTLRFANAACSYPSAREQLIPMFPDARVRGITTFAFIGEESLFSQGALQEFSRLSQEQKVTLVHASTIPPDSLDFKSIISRALVSKPDAVLIATLDPAKSLAMLRQIKEQGFKGVRYAFIDYDQKYYEQFGDSISGVILPGWISSRYTPEFVASYRKRWSTSTHGISLYAAHSYDITMYASQSALARFTQGLRLRMEDLVTYPYQDAAIPGFHYRLDRSVSIPIVVKVIGENGLLHDL